MAYKKSLLTLLFFHFTIALHHFCIISVTNLLHFKCVNSNNKINSKGHFIQKNREISDNQLFPCFSQLVSSNCFPIYSQDICSCFLCLAQSGIKIFLILYMLQFLLIKEFQSAFPQFPLIHHHHVKCTLYRQR